MGNSSFNHNWQRR